MKRLAIVLLALTLPGCWGGFNGDFSTNECAAFAAQYRTLGGLSDAIDEDGRAEIQARTARECSSGTLGLSREEYACAMKAGSRQEWIDCGIVLKG